MNDTEYKLYRALYFYKKTRDGESYNEVVDALKLCLQEDCNGWLAAKVTGKDGDEVAMPGVMGDSEGKSYYILCPNEEDMGQMEEEGLSKLHVNLRAVCDSVIRESSIGGICLNPWDGGCYISADEIEKMMK